VTEIIGNVTPDSSVTGQFTATHSTAATGGY